MLWSFDNLAVDAEQVRTLERLESEVVVVEVTVVDDLGVKAVRVLHDEVVERLGDERRVLPVPLVHVAPHELHGRHGSLNDLFVDLCRLETAMRAASVE